jgi:hypothetical protein
MPEKWAGFALQTCRPAARFVGLPRSYVAAFILARSQVALWMASPAVQRLARKMLSKAWPDVAGYTYAETSRGLGVKIQISRLPHSTSNSREAQ